MAPRQRQDDLGDRRRPAVGGHLCHGPWHCFVFVPLFQLGHSLWHKCDQRGVLAIEADHPLEVSLGKPLDFRPASGSERHWSKTETAQDWQGLDLATFPFSTDQERKSSALGGSLRTRRRTTPPAGSASAGGQLSGYDLDQVSPDREVARAPCRAAVPPELLAKGSLTTVQPIPSQSEPDRPCGHLPTPRPLESRGSRPARCDPPCPSARDRLPLHHPP